MSRLAEVSCLGSVAEISRAAATPEIGMLLDTADRVLRDTASRRRFRLSRGDVDAARKNGIWAALSGLGLTGACAPTRVGGVDLGMSAGILLAEVLGRNLAPEPFVACGFFPSVFLGLVEHPVADQILADAVQGATMPVMAVDESDPAHAIAEISQRDGHLILAGIRRYVHGAAWATHFIVSARMSGEPCAAIVPAGAEGLRLDILELADGSFRGDIEFDGVELDAAAIIATGVRCAEMLACATDWTNVALSAELFGVQTALFGMTLDYLKTRSQFDRLIGSFQVLQHRAVDLYCAKEITRYVIAEAIEEMGAISSPSARARIASRCKARAADSTLRAGREAVQMHGAMGFSDESDVGLYLKRALVLSAWLGGADHHRRRWAWLDPPVLG